MTLLLASHTSDAGALVGVVSFGSVIAFLLSTVAVCVQFSFARRPARNRASAGSAFLTALAALAALILGLPLLATLVLYAAALPYYFVASPWLAAIAVLIAVAAIWATRSGKLGEIKLLLQRWSGLYDPTRYARGALISAIAGITGLIFLLQLFAWGICPDDCSTEPPFDPVQALGVLAAALLVSGLLLRLNYRRGRSTSSL